MARQPIQAAVSAALAVALAAAVAAVVVGVASRDGRLACLVLLDLLTAAGILHLSAAPTYMSVAMAACIVMIRKLIGSALGMADAVVSRRQQPARPRPARRPGRPSRLDL